MASLARLIGTMPVPIFGSARTGTMFVAAKARTLPRMAGWLVPLSAGALWFVWPAVDDGWKIEVGIMADPEAAAKGAADGAPGGNANSLFGAAMAKVGGAHKAHENTETDDDKMLANAFASGDFSELQANWEEFAEKSSRPGEDDDEEDDDDDDEEEDDDDDDDDDDEDDDGQGIFRNEIIVEKL